jgi:phosphatidylglycerophosphatase A
MDRVTVLISTFGYVGYFPIAPGTAGSAAGIAVYALIHALGMGALELPIVVLLFAAGVAVGTRAERCFECLDPGPCVIDEVMGMMLTLLLIPVGWGGIALGFVLFRVLDVVKPFPAKRLERLRGGWGMMADDAMSAVYANLLLRAAWWMLPGWIG